MVGYPVKGLRYLSWVPKEEAGVRDRMGSQGGRGTAKRGIGVDTGVDISRCEKSKE